MFKSKKWWLLPVTLVVLSMALAACGGAAAPAEEEPMEEEEAMAEEPMAEAGVIRVYTSWPLQGSMLPIGEGMRNSTNLALEHYLADNPDGPGGY
jgi:hypothetical protein